MQGTDERADMIRLSGPAIIAGLEGCRGRKAPSGASVWSAPCDHHHINHIGRVGDGPCERGAPEGATQGHVGMIDMAGDRGPGRCVADASAGHR